MALRVRTACQHIAQARLKSPPSKFLKYIFLDDVETPTQQCHPSPKVESAGDMPETVERSEADESAAASTAIDTAQQADEGNEGDEDKGDDEYNHDYLFGFYRSTLQAWRSIDQNKKNFEYTKNMRVVVGEVIAKWDDGDETILVGLSSESVKAIEQCQHMDAKPEAETVPAAQSQVPDAAVAPPVAPLAQVAPPDREPTPVLAKSMEPDKFRFEHPAEV